MAGTEIYGEQMIRRLEEQLSEAHASNGALRERLAEADKEVKIANAQAAKGRDDSLRLEDVSLKLKQAESLTHATVRKQRDAEAEVRRLSDENEELQGLIDALRADAERLSELNLRIESAKSVHDIFGGTK